MVTSCYFCHRTVTNLSRIILLPMVSRPRRKIIWRFSVVGITSPTAKQIFATWKTRWWISFQFSHAVSLKGTRVAFFMSGITPSGITVSGVIAVVFILETPAKRKKKKNHCALNWNILDIHMDFRAIFSLPRMYFPLSLMGKKKFKKNYKRFKRVS